MTAKTAPRCVHQTPGGCPSCRHFSRSLATATTKPRALWHRGILAHLNRQSEAAR